MLLDGRYRLLQRRTKDGPAATWDGEDDQLLRPVVIHVVSGPAASEAVDAARRSASVEDERLPHLLDVGLDRAVDGTALGWVVTERAPGRSLAELLREAPLPPARARALVGEAAAVLARASRSGLHHRRLEPTTVLLTADGGVSVLGLEIASAAAGAPARTPEEAEREDAEGLVRLLYSALTGLWPAGRSGSLGAAPTGRGGAPVSPAQLAPGVPNDLDALCTAVLGPYRDGPRTPADVAAALAPWGSATGPVTRTGLGIAVPQTWPAAPAASTEPVAPPSAGGWTSAPVRARLGGGPGLHFAAGADPDDADPDDADEAAPERSAPRAAELGAPSSRGEPGTADPSSQGTTGTRVLRPPAAAVAQEVQAPTSAPQVAPLDAGHETRASRRAAQRIAERQAGAFDALLGPVSGPRPAVPAAEVAPPSAGAPTAGPAPAAGPARRPTVHLGAPPAPRPSRPGHASDPSAFDDTDSTDWVDAGWGAAPASARPVAATRRSARHDRADGHRADRQDRADRHDDAAPDRASRGRARRPRRGVVIAAAAAAVVVLGGTAVVATTDFARLGGALGIAPSDTSAPGTGPATAAGAAAPAAGAAAPAAGDPATTGAAPAADVTSAVPADPFGDGTENEEAAPRAVDGDLATSWSSSTYSNAALGNLKRGVGLSLVLGDGGTPSTVSAVRLTTQGTGGTVEVRSSPDGGYEGSTVLATAAAGTGGSAVEVALDEPATTGHLLLWFTQLPLTPTGYTAVVDEVSAR